MIMTEYGKPAFYKITDIDFDKKMEDVHFGNYQGLNDYFRQRYGIEIKVKNQPLLVVENKIQRKKANNTDTGPTYLPPEVCCMTGIPDNFDERRRKAISDKTILFPKEKHREIEGLLTELKNAYEL